MTGIPIFKCCACGRCCSNIRGLGSKEEKEFIMEYGHGKLPVIELIDADRLTFPLWNFEARRFREYERKAGIDAGIVPSRGVMDLKSGKFIVIAYQMTADAACPFLLKSGKCGIYDTKRAYVCHLFPLKRSPYLRLEAESKDIFGKCHTLDKFKDLFDFSEKNVLLKQLYGSLGDALLNAVQHDIVIEWSNKAVMEMMRIGLIRPAMNYPVDFLMKRIENSILIDLSDFIVESGFKTREEMDRITERFENLDGARERLSKDSIIN